ncbi:aminotransferase class III-fold pyridoxal phosphate-dependent enzyme, partial [Pseudomonas aeruginosa]
AGIAPDFLCLSKALTGGYLPMSAVLTSETVYRGFYDDYQTLRAFLHSHTYTGNPLACAAALATLDIFEEDKVIEANRALSTHMARATAHPGDMRVVGQFRGGPGYVVVHRVFVVDHLFFLEDIQGRQGVGAGQRVAGIDCLL